jgi:Uma2 family endonuclease
MNWQEVCANPNLQNLPFKIELNERGQIIMSPAKIAHAAFQGQISFHLQLLGASGKVLAECAVATPHGTKVADVAWASRERFAIIKNETECSIAPEVCVEVFSNSNTQEEMDEKRELYPACGAREVRFCDEQGNISFYGEDGKLAQSELFPAFSTRP